MKEKDIKRILFNILGYSPVIVTAIFILTVFWFFVKMVMGTVSNTLTYSEITLLLYTSLMLALLALLINLVVFMMLKTLNLLRLEEKRMESTSELFYFLTLILPIIKLFIKKKKKEEKK